MNQNTGIISIEGKEATITFERRLPHPEWVRRYDQVQPAYAE